VTGGEASRDQELVDLANRLAVAEESLRAVQAGEILQRAMRGEIAPRTLRAHRPMLDEVNGGRTDIGPMVERIRQAIAESETSHSGEIRFAVEAALPMSYLRRDAPARERAEMMFSKLRVWDTAENNGVLIYVELADHKIEIVVDRGIGGRVAAAEWTAIAAAMRDRIQAGDFEAGALAGIQAVGALLARHYPLAEGERNPNELPDQPTVL